MLRLSKDKTVLRIMTLFLFVICVVPFLSCDIFDSDGDEIIAIESKIKFFIKEGYFEGEYYYPDSICEPRIILSMMTEKIYGGCNFSIVSTISRRGGLMIIDLIGIYIPPIIFLALGPARASHFLDIPEGKHPLCFRHGSLYDGYAITVTDSCIEVTEAKANFTILEYNLFWRYPPNSFVYLCGTMDETKWICEDFLDSLLKEVDLREFKFPDYGTIPYPCSSQGHYYDMPAKYFFYEKEEDFDKCGEILKSYTENVISHYSGVSISLTNWKNKYFLSWLFEED